MGELILSWGDYQQTFIHKQSGYEVKGVWGNFH